MPVLQLEALISQHPAVAEVAVIAVADADWGERPCALIVLTADSKQRTTQEDIRSFLEGSAREGLIPRYAIPQHIRFVTALARTSVGKLDKKLMRLQFSTG